MWRWQMVEKMLLWLDTTLFSGRATQDVKAEEVKADCDFSCRKKGLKFFSMYLCWCVLSIFSVSMYCVQTPNSALIKCNWMQLTTFFYTESVITTIHRNRCQHHDRHQFVMNMTGQVGAGVTDKTTVHIISSHRTDQTWGNRATKAALYRMLQEMWVVTRTKAQLIYVFSVTYFLLYVWFVGCIFLDTIVFSGIYMRTRKTTNHLMTLLRIENFVMVLKSVSPEMFFKHIISLLCWMLWCLLSFLNLTS